MAIRFSSFEFYKTFAPIDPSTGKISSKAVFFCEIGTLYGTMWWYVLISGVQRGYLPELRKQLLL